MSVRVWLAALTTLATLTALTAPAAAAQTGSAAPPADQKASHDAFYRKYLVAGNHLDDLIVEQEKRVHDSPNDAGLRNDFGNLLAQRHFPKEAAEQYETAAKLDHANFISLYNLGLLRESEGKFSEAIGAYQRAISRKHGFPPVHFRLGRLYEKTERTDAAVAEYATALRIDPSMRNPHRNPLVVDSELIYRASLANYSQDVATATMGKDSVFVEESRFRVVPVDRPVSSQEAADDTEATAEPRKVGVSDTAGTAGSEPSSAAAPGSRKTGTGGAPGTRPPPRATQGQRPRPAARGGTPMVAAPPGPAAATAPPPPVEIAPPPSGEPEPPPESMPEPTPAAPSAEEEPS